MSVTMIAHLIFIYCLVICVNTNFMDLMRPKTVRIYQFKGKCPGYENAPMYLKDIQWTLVNRINYVSLKRVLKYTINDDLRVDLDIKRCQTRESLDSCEKYQAIHINHLCDILNAENKPWTPLVQHSQPSFGCPLKKGVSIVKNGSFDGSAFDNLPISGWFWKVTPKVYNARTNDLIFCMYLEAQLAPV